MYTIFKKKKVSSLPICGIPIYVLTLQIAHGNFLMLCQMVLLPNININFVMNRDNKSAN